MEEKNLEITLRITEIQAILENNLYEDKKFTFLVIVHTTMMTGDFMMITRLHTRKRTKIRQLPMGKSM